MRESVPPQKGIALISTVAFTMFLAALSALLMRYSFQVVNVASTERDRIQIRQLENAAVRYSVVLLLAPRKEVISGGIPTPSFTYREGRWPVRVNIENEAAKINPLNINADVLAELLKNLGYSESVSNALLAVKSTSPETNRSSILSAVLTNFHRFRVKKLERERFFQHFSLLNSANSVNVHLVSEQLLRAIPNLSDVDVNSILEERMHKSLISSSVSHPLLSNRASDHYRITTEIIGAPSGKKSTRIIKINTMSFPPFTLVSRPLLTSDL